LCHSLYGINVIKKDEDDLELGEQISELKSQYAKQKDQVKLFSEQLSLIKQERKDAEEAELTGTGIYEKTNTVKEVDVIYRDRADDGKEARLNERERKLAEQERVINEKLRLLEQQAQTIQDQLNNLMMQKEQKKTKKTTEKSVGTNYILSGAVPRNPLINKRTKVTEETTVELGPTTYAYSDAPITPSNKSTPTRTVEPPKQPTYGQVQQPANRNNGPQQPNYAVNTRNAEFAQPERAEYAQPQQPQRGEYAQPQQPQRGQYAQPQRGEYVQPQREYIQPEYTQRDSMQYPSTLSAQPPAYATYVQPEYPS